MKYFALGIMVLLISCKSRINPESKRLAEESELFYASNDWEKIIDLNNQALEIDEGNYVAFNNRAWAKFKLGFDSLDVFSDLYNALELKEDYMIAKRNLIVMFFAFGNYREVISRGEKYLNHRICNSDLKDKDGHIFSLVGESHNKLENWESAMKYLSRAIDIDPSDSGAFKERGMTNRKLKNLDESISDLNKAIELDPEFEQAINSRGITWDEMGKHELAIADYSRAIEMDSTASEFWFNRGLSYLDSKLIDKACKDWKKALELGHPQAHEPINDKCK
jgi:tetratricopeptide (TPR) repeat protein